jgi:dihydroxyacetone kinase-like protein
MTFKNQDGLCIVKDLVKIIQDNKDFLSEVDGKIGDGDHGINMNKGFSLCGTRIEGKAYSMSEGFEVLGKTLLGDIGGSMGPLYGALFDEFAIASKGHEEIDAQIIEAMLNSALAAVQEIGSAHRGDKTLLDTLIPAVEAFTKAASSGMDLGASLEAMIEAAEAGWKSTEGMVAKIGRASRLGERSRGVLDAGATSCFLIIKSMGGSIRGLLSR